VGLAIQRGLLSYVEGKVKADKSLVLGQHETPLLLYAVATENADDQLCSWAPEMANLLLRYGANPNQLWYGNTRWQHALTWAHEQLRSLSAALVKTVLSYGASPFTTCTQNHYTSLKIIKITRIMHPIL
jgi:hypothetical protein